MATKKSSNTNKNSQQKLFAATPYIIPSQFELETFNATEGTVGFSRRVIEVVNKIRELESLKSTTDYEKSRVQANVQVLKDWLGKFNIDTLVDAVSKWQDNESNYWVDILGKRAAIEIIAENKISTETMSKMTMLPEEDYIKATQLCVKLANAIKAATVKAEEGVGVFVPNTNTSKDEESPKKGFNIKNKSK